MNAPTPTPANYRWILLAAGIVLADTSIMNVVAPQIQREIGGTVAGLQLAIAGYQVAYASVLVIAGGVGDRWGRPKVLGLAVLAFALSSLLCAMAPNMGSLIAFRVLQGLSAGFVSPQVLGMVRAAPEELRPRLLSGIGMVMSLATVAGPVLAGALVALAPDALSWRLVFLVNLPICLGVWLFGSRRLAAAPSGALAGRLDYVGAVALATVVSGISLATTVGRSLGWPAWSLILLVVQVPITWFFVAHESSQHRRGLPCIVPISAFRGTGLLMSTLGYFLFFSASTCFFLYFSIFIERGTGGSPLTAGLVLAPYGVGAAVSARASAGLTKRHGQARVAIGGALLCGIGSFATFLTVHYASRDAIAAAVAPSLVVTGLGLGLVVTSILGVVLSTAPAADAGSVGGTLSTAQQIGGVAGILIFGLFMPSGAGTALRYLPLRHGIERGVLYETAMFLVVALLLVRTRTRASR